MNDQPRLADLDCVCGDLLTKPRTGIDSARKRPGPPPDPGGAAFYGLIAVIYWFITKELVGSTALALTGGLAFGANGVPHALALLAAGVVTTVPLLLFAAGARRIPLVVLGLTQFLTPILQFLLGWLVLAEPMPPERWIGFALVWLALVVLMADMIIASRPPRRASLERV